MVVDTRNAGRNPPAKVAPPTAPTALPAPPTPLIGREAELAAVRHALLSPGTRMVTLTGPPGVGKTRLALAAAGDVATVFGGGAIWIDLAPVRESGLVLAEIARMLGVGGGPGEPPSARLRAALADREVLLVMDNCEHLIDAGPQLAQLLSSNPRLRVLATSRERLHIAAEQEFAVPPLPMPPDPNDSDLRRLAGNPAIALLLARSATHVTLTERNARSLSDICVRLDGLPLAIELAAARLRVFTPGELAFRLEHRMAVLTGGSRDLPGRHRDLRSAIAWSHDLLPESDRAMFRRLSVFVGGWTLEAATAVCGDGETDASDAIESLLDKSMIRRAIPEDEAAQFTMLQSLREYATEQLELHGDGPTTLARHTRYFADGASRWESTVGTNDETSGWSWLGYVHGDLRAAFDQSRADGDVIATLKLAIGLGWYWYTRGSLADRAPLLDSVAAAAADPRVPPELLAAALIGAGLLAFALGDLAAADGALRRSVALSQQNGDDRRVAIASAFLGHVSRGQGRYDEAADRYEAARSIYARLGNSRGTAWASYDLGLLAGERGDLPEAESLLRDALRLFRDCEYPWAIAVSAWGLATVLLRRGKVDEPVRLLGESLVLHEGVGDRRGRAQCLEALADVAFTRGATPTAGRLLGAAAALRLVIAALPTEAEQANLTRLENAVDATLGTFAADHARQAGRTMPYTDAIALAASVASAGADSSADGDASAGEDSTAGGDVSVPARPAIDLTPRQRQVAALIAASCTNRQIGRTLGISEKTAEVHVRSIMERLHTASRAGVAAWAVAHGLTPPPAP